MAKSVGPGCGPKVYGPGLIVIATLVAIFKNALAHRLSGE